MRFKWTTRTFFNAFQSLEWTNEWMNYISISLRLIIAIACSLATSYFISSQPLLNQGIVRVVVIIVVAVVNAFKVFSIKNFMVVSVDSLMNCNLFWSINCLFVRAFTFSPFGLVSMTPQINVELYTKILFSLNFWSCDFMWGTTKVKAYTYNATTIASFHYNM